jgi:cadmium resistance protein CadD (predicted permease)
MEFAVLGKAAAMFAVTNVDDLVVLAVFFGRAGRVRSDAIRVVVGQYLGFVAILAASVLGALGASLLPDSALPYLGLLPLILGIKAAWDAWLANRQPDVGGEMTRTPVTITAVASVTFANGGDNIGVYVPVFAVAGVGGMATYVVIFLAGVALLCAVGWHLASRPAVARLLDRWDHALLPAVLITIGVLILVEGGAFGL